MDGTGILARGREGNVIDRAISLACALMWWPCYPLLAVMQITLIHRPTATYYMSAERDAVIAISTTRKGWHVSDHGSAAPGTAQGKNLRTALLPHLTEQARSDNISIHATAANAKLAAL
ncbi:hypothetical protein [Arthrobacter sp.]|uniref:hypothetical protein n=1 Tax=Arthrobacter sp. TaxID=1667 RepID=UPI0026DEEAB2|nr:hypothetical protein [Arthrobacter sp.]MDO5753208.1 hypothetical protein [Arthrobacter sp.]